MASVSLLRMLAQRLREIFAQAGSMVSSCWRMAAGSTAMAAGGWPTSLA
jgi:hypothetical protein